MQWAQVLKVSKTLGILAIFYSENPEWKRDWEQMRRRKEMRDKCMGWIQLARDGGVVKRVMNFRVV
jgi:hypothetical protein